jgi:hypothetical protein
VNESPDNIDGVIYAIDLEADSAIEGPFDTWLRDHIADVLQFDGFLTAEIFEEPAESEARIRRTIQYRVRSRQALNNYLLRHAPEMREHGTKLFGDRFTAEGRILSHREEFAYGAVSTDNCLNCGEVLTGQHCSHCGQRATVRVLSLWGLLKELFGDLTEWDSRVWRTLRPLAFKPGFLTVDYLRGRRARYTPPFRMYLILSLGFFLLASNTTDLPGSLDVNVGAEGNTQLSIGVPAPETSQSSVPDPSDQAEKDASTEAATDTRPVPEEIDLSPSAQYLIDELVKRVPEKDREAVIADLQRGMARLTPEQIEVIEAGQKVLSNPCSEENFRLDLGPGTEPLVARLREACTRIVADEKGFGRALFENIPKMLFAFLPLMALVMYLLYLGSGRYYVEHLLFFVHFHSFFFLAGIVIALMAEAAQLTAGSVASNFDNAANAMTAALVFYAPYYLYKAMRRVYQQSPGWTLLKFGALTIAYIVALILTGLGLLAYTALTL